MEDESTTPSNALTNYRTSLHELLDSERWAHHRTMQTLRAEAGHREQLERQLTYMRNEYQGLSNSLARSAHNLMMCDAERINLIGQVTSLRGELENWQRAYNQAMEEVLLCYSALCYITLLTDTALK